MNHLANRLAELTVVVPVYNDEAALNRLLAWLGEYALTVIVVDGAPMPDEAQETTVLGDRVQCIHSPASRGGQIAAGIAQANTPWIWVLHADSAPQAKTLTFWAALIAAAAPAWGRFDVDLPGLAWVAWSMNWRSKLTKICTGDQGMFFHCDLLKQIGGFPRQALMEDVEVSRRLKQKFGAAFQVSNARVASSPRRWQKHGVVKTIVTMWWFRLRYFLGADASSLAKKYYG